MYLQKVLINIFFFCIIGLVPALTAAQDRLPRDNGLATYHTEPRYRESESHPLRILAYGVHPVGWLARELVFRPFSYFASSTETTQSIFGYREPYDFREPECFSADSNVPDCRSIVPFNYGAGAVGTGLGDITDDDRIAAVTTGAERHVYFPDVNFDFDVRNLNDLGRGRVHQLAQLLDEVPGVHIVLEGHADYLGSVEYNDALGMDRAETVRQELINLGVSPERLSTVTFGKSKPALSQETDWARAVNRRVAVHLDEG